MADIIQVRRDLAANWTNANPTLAQGEMGLETDTLKIKYGDGSTAWNSLAYFVAVAGPHTVASHSDTTATGAELESLTDNSIADALHRHSELVASDGTPDPALSIDADGNVIIGTGDLQVIKLNKGASFGGADFSDYWIDFRNPATFGAQFGLSAATFGNTTGAALLKSGGSRGIAFKAGDGEAFSSVTDAHLFITDSGSIGINDTTPSFKLDVNGDGRFTGKLTTLGAVDPPGVLYDSETRASTVARVKREVPKDKLGGCFMFYNGESGNMELYFPATGEFKNFNGELIDSVEPVTETFATIDKYHLDELTGDVIKTQVEALENKKYKVKEGYSLDSKTGKFCNKQGKEVKKNKAVEYVNKVKLLKGI